MKKLYNFSVKSLAFFGFCLTSLSTIGQTYCGGGPSSTFDSNVEAVTLVGNSSSINYTGCPGVTGTQDLTGVHFTDLERGVTYTVDITWGFCNSFSYTGYGKMWIDFDGNQTFDPAEELVSVSVPNSAQPLAGTYTFTVPLTAAIGATRMRVKQHEGGSATATTPCNSYTWGSAQDFGINIIDCSAGPSYSAISAGPSCGYYTAPSGAQFHNAGTYTDTIVNHLGCDSVITITLSTNNTYTTINPVACGTYTVPSGSYSVGQSGTYYDTIPNTAGCDSVITINLTSNNTVNSFATTACNVYTAPSGAQYTLSGIYNDTIPNAAGCDSIMTINLDMYFDNSLTIFVTTCGQPYTSNAGNTYTTTGIYSEFFTSVNGCDSIVYIDLDVAEGNTTDEIVNACDEYTSPSGMLYTSSGTYTETFVGSTGCDSIINYSITINSVNNLANYVSALTIEAVENGATYQWVDCLNNNTPIVGATGKVFVASVNGTYACQVTKNGCTELTNCVKVYSLAVDENNSIFTVYPNPSTGAFSIELSEVTANSKVEITNSAGQIIYQSAINKSKTNFSLDHVEAGIYFVTVSNENTTAKKAIVIQ